MGELAVMGRQGDTKITWDSTRPQEVESARRAFDELRAKGYLAFAMRGEGKGEQIYDFRPGAERIILAPPMQGGAPCR